MSRFHDAKMPGAKHHVSWETDDVPRSSVFDDTFYTKENGQAETAYVFIDGNGLPERWPDAERFSIGELGFGTGLNFLETWRHWITARSPSQQLVFTSFEAYPISADDMARALAPWQSLKPLSEALVSRWQEPSTQPAPWHMDEQTVLQVIPGKASGSVAQWGGMADAWYLDGFSPAKNPEMWGPELMQQVYEHTSLSGSFATYTAAAQVRRNLQAAGFAVTRREGFAGKREMLLGRKQPGT
ncbi:tRNA (5-methylaminomethyl-2-thiouridine)(34)-methyltransferase MnmD [Anderseniella sp. Alg231-50]|uniref:tRNA (5-methylaminomethyl-2-thiouridine)(34)-methyltransferase MnmD n=1 Tax=Anderseniella sp. Alg231-50 TaxID=1922226 RepID=UPI00307C1319